MGGGARRGVQTGGMTLSVPTLADPGSGLPVLGMPTVTPHSSLYNGLMGALTGNPQYQMLAPQAHQALQAAQQSAAALAGSLSGPGFQQMHPALQQLLMPQRTPAMPAQPLSNFSPWLGR